ncbi:M66 family metalloprotease [Arthrobacter sp. GMC3]|uniref:M66 family metalloprotease n=1 Tax=Arthrobacter sp. GMC3 TaxID=2058894 RepID=UPI0015E38555|nr:M66 family metalloprotease [Arthrobacter sp. GMC3]
MNRPMRRPGRRSYQRVISGTVLSLAVAASALGTVPAVAAPAIPATASAAVLAAGTATIDLEGVSVTGQLADVARDVLLRPYVAGEKVKYTFTVSNRRTETVTVLPTSGPFKPFVPADGGGNCRFVNLKPGASYNCTTTSHTVTPAEIDAGSFATASEWQVGAVTKTLATPPVTVRANVATDVGQVRISGTPAVPQRDTTTAPYAVGEALPYSFTVTNTGAGAVDVAPTAGSFAPFLPADGPGNCSYTGLAPGASYTCATARHAVTREELDRGFMVPVTNWTAGTQSASVTTDALKLGTPLADPNNAYLAEPGKDRGLGFHDVTKDGTPRDIRNDLATGPLSGMVEFAQSHTIDPAGNGVKEMPNLVAARAALLLFTPTQETTGVSVRVTVKGVDKGTLALKPPAELAQTDAKYTGARPAVVYSKRAWSIDLPWDSVMPGLELAFTDSAGAAGTLPATAITIGAPTEMVVNNIELGMLTTPNMNGDHYFINNPAASASDYFQTIPVSKLIMAKYESVQLNKVIVANGNIYTPENPSVTNGDVYSGDMRENVGKAQVSTGINLANFGITSGPMNQSQPSVYNQRIIHHSAGLYANGRAEHGLSGGNGMATVYSTSGNELSHELGHSYGLGHYPGQNSALPGDAATINATHHADSGWGYNAYRGLLRTNLNTSGPFNAQGTSVNGLPFLQNFAGSYNYMTDAMSGGSVASNASKFTLHTGYSAKRIQDNFKTVVADLAYPSGYRDWDAATGGFVDAKAKNAAFNYLRPAAVGVPVVTLLGGYVPADPAKAVLYPSFRSNWGNSFDYPAPATDGPAASRVCWMDVSFLDGRTKQYALSGGVAGVPASNALQFNINIAASEKPTGADLLCKSNGATKAYGNHVTIATDLAPMPDAVTVGQEAGYSALQQAELPKLQTELESLSSQTMPVLTSDGAMMLNTWRSQLGTLSAPAQAMVAKLDGHSAAATNVEKFLSYYRDSLSTAPTQARLQALLADGKLVNAGSKVISAGGAVRVDASNSNAGYCLKLYANDDGTLEARVPTPATSGTECTGAANETWLMDGRGAVHNGARPDLCLTSADPSRPTRCAVTDGQQKWLYHADGHLNSVASPGKSMDLNRATRKPILYGTASGSNQKWVGLSYSSSPALVLLDAAVLKKLGELGL